MKAILFLVSFFMLSAVNANSFYSNMIIFGDSQSDIGDGPESILYNEDPTNPDQLAAHIYVPVTNPTDPLNDIILPIFPDLTFPNLNNTFKYTLISQPNICILNASSTKPICYTKKFLAFNWSVYFLSNGVERHLFNSDADLRPWIVQFEQSTGVTLNQSVNYAWYSALSDDQCYAVGYAVKSCAKGNLNVELTLDMQQYRYRNFQGFNPNDNYVLMENLIIPSVQKQIEIFKIDLQNKKIKVDEHTLYIIWGGANDLAVSFNNFVKTKKKAVFLNDLLNVIPARIAGPDVYSAVNRLKGMGAKHILVMGQFNLGLTPQLLISDLNMASAGPVALHAVADAFGLLMKLFNRALQRDVANLSIQDPNFDLRFVDLQKPMEAVNKLFLKRGYPGYWDTIGERCDSALTPSGTQKLLQGEAVSCYEKDVKAPILFWNFDHLATQGNQVIANALLTNLQQTQRKIDKVLLVPTHQQIDRALDKIYTVYLTYHPNH